MSDDTLDIAVPPAETRTAKLSADLVYRYTLTRTWTPGRPVLPFIMLNPSTADAHDDDPTIRRCRGFARDMGYGGFGVVNLYAYRATKPEVMFAAMAKGTDVVGPENNAVIADTLAWAADLHSPVVAAWGVHAREDRVAEVLAMPHARDVLHHLGLTAGGQPRHPLMLRKTARLTRWQP